MKPIKYNKNNIDGIKFKMNNEFIPEEDLEVVYTIKFESPEQPYVTWFDEDAGNRSTRYTIDDILVYLNAGDWEEI